MRSDGNGWHFRLGGGATQASILFGICLIIFGVILLSPVIRWIITIFAWLAIILGIIAIVLGIVNWIASPRSRSS